MSYDVQARAPNLDGLALDAKQLLFYSYAYAIQREMAERGVHAPPNDAEWDWWGAKSYSREERVPSQ